MEIQRYDSGILSSNMYVISESGHAVVIDPSRDVMLGLGLKVDLLLVTHEHYDHISGVNNWKKAYGVPLLCSESCAERIKDPRKNQARHFDIFCEIQSMVNLDAIPEIDSDYVCQADWVFTDEASFSWQGHIFRLQEMPGHSPGSIGIFVDEKHFFSGDSLLKDREIELRFPSGSKKQWESIGKPRLDVIPVGITVWPGHFDSFIRESNPI